MKQCLDTVLYNRSCKAFGPYCDNVRLLPYGDYTCLFAYYLLLIMKYDFILKLNTLLLTIMIQLLNNVKLEKYLPLLNDIIVRVTCNRSCNSVSGPYCSAVIDLSCNATISC